nr:phage portal protein [uncultured Dongia sp.]
MGVPLIINQDGTPMRRASHQVTAYQAADPASQDMANWWPSLASADYDLLHNRDRITARIRDIARNNGWAAGIVGREIDNVIGGGLRLSVKPDYAALGLDAEWAHEWSKEVEAAWRTYANDPGFYCDASRHSQMGGLFGLAYRHYVVDGDALGVLVWEPNRGGAFATALRVVDPDRLSNPNQGEDTDFLRGGVEIDHNTAAIAYHFRKRHPHDVGTAMDAWIWERIARDTPWGRPQVIHHFDKERDGLSRGVGRLTPILERLKMLDRYDKVELQAAVLNAILAAFIESPFDHNLLQGILEDGQAANLNDYQTARSGFHENKAITLGGIRVPALFPGEKLGFQTVTRPNSSFDAFQATVLRNIAAGTGTSYEQLSKDWSKTNYSSARASLLDMWKTMTYRRDDFAQGFSTPVYLGFLEEAIDKGIVRLPPNAPDFYEARAAYAKCRWIGPGRGWVDPVKEIQAAVLRMAAGISTLEDEVAEQGGDYQEKLQQIMREIKECQAAGIVHPSLRSFATLMVPQQDEREGSQAPGNSSSGEQAA